MKRLTCGICALLLLAGCGARGGAENSGEEITRKIFQEGERFAGYEVLDQEGNRVEISQLPGRDRIIFYLSSTCGDCIREYEQYELLAELYPATAEQLHFLWQTSYPDEPETLAGSNAYTVPGDLRLGDWVPTYFLMDGDGKITHKSIELVEAFAAFAAEQSPAEHAEVLAAYLDKGREALLLLDSAPDAELTASAADTVSGLGLESYRVIDCTTAGTEETDEAVWADFTDSAGILSTLGGVSKFPALVYPSDGKAAMLDLSTK